MCDSLERGEDVIVDCLALSHCHYLVKNRSCISDLSLILNPDLGCSLIMTEAEVYRKEPGEKSFGTKSSLPPLNMRVAANSSPAE